MHKRITSEIERARELLRDLPDDSMETVERLGEARQLLDDALNDAMAEAALKGASLRSVALRAGLSPNAVPPRLARTQTLSGYSDPDGKVGSSSVERARYDSELGRPAPEPKMTFKRRRAT
jgi:hypothetical protein